MTINTIVRYTDAGRLTHLQTRPAPMLDALGNWLRERRIELPPYNTLREVVANALEGFDLHLQTVIEQHLTPPEKNLLDGLLNNATPPHTGAAPARYPLTELKSISQSMQPKAIAQRVNYLRKVGKSPTTVSG